LRLGYVVGNAGLGKALIIIGLANAISVLTSISLSAIATNLKVKVGGPYYIIKDPDKSIVSGVLAAEDIDLDAEHEEGKQAEVAAALDALADTEEKARKAEKAATEVTEQVEKKLPVQ
jgi:hypothetical protein